MSDVFISYASKDRERAKALAEELAHSGLGVWWDRDLVAGDRFAESIQKELDDAKCVLVLWSQASVGSDWTREEAEEGKRAKVLVPVFIDPGVEIPLGFRSVQTQNLVDWDGDVTDPRFRQLLEAVDKKLHRRRSITKLLALQPRWRSVSRSFKAAIRAGPASSPLGYSVTIAMSMLVAMGGWWFLVGPGRAPVEVTLGVPADSVNAAPVAESDPAADRSEIEGIIQAYGDALDSEDIGQLRQIHPDITQQEVDRWSEFFGIVRNLTVQLTINDLQITGDAAHVVVDMVQEYQAAGIYVTPSRFTAHLVRTATGWRLLRVGA